ncbi:protein LURP-one-related 7 [Herrania umbratica]|uniref:Protein LURP-one-related 7 n=1 Tax=Herrania umbratica TaxID=108875 RepID=A0A6J0ZWU5_9ROSI|nr:protein LURP-one-related 7 [Herrania umbratica]
MVSTIYLVLHAWEAERDNIPMTTSAPVRPANSPIPIDLFVSKRHPGLPRGVLGFADSSGKIVFRVNRQTSLSSADDRTVLLDSAGNPLISTYRHHDGSWQGFNGDDGKKGLVFKVQRVSNKFTRTELEVFLGTENQGELTCDFKVKGCHFQRSCTIYKGDSLVAQTSLMHKLRQVYVRRSKFRITIFPGSVDPSLVVALVVIFLDNGPKKFQVLDKFPLSI